jgi:hypothetical protein
MTEKTKLSLASKLANVSKACGYVQKQGFNKMQNYKYAQAADVLGKVNEACAEQGIAVTSNAELLEWREVTNSKGNVGSMITVRVTLTLHDTESDATLSAVGLGTGQDYGDKAIAKAQTMAHKYAWMHSLNIATGDDPEADENTDKEPVKSKPKTTESKDKPTAKQLKLIYALAGDKGIKSDQAKEIMNNLFGKTSTKELTQDETRKFITYLQEYGDNDDKS